MRPAPEKKIENFEDWFSLSALELGTYRVLNLGVVKAPMPQLSKRSSPSSRQITLEDPETSTRLCANMRARE